MPLRRVERQVADVKTWRRHFDRLRFTLRPGLLLLLVLRLMLLLPVPRLDSGFSLAATVSPEKCDDALPKCFLLRSLRALLLGTPAPALSSRAPAPIALASPV